MHLKKLAAWVILVGLILQNFSGATILASYYINSAAYAKNCENRDKPIMHCNGKCQMMKQMKQAEKKDASDPVRKLELRFIAFSSKSYFAGYQGMILKNIPEYFIQPNSAISAGIAFPVFHPPSV